MGHFLLCAYYAINYVNRALVLAILCIKTWYKLLKCSGKNGLQIESFKRIYFFIRVFVPLQIADFEMAQIRKWFPLWNFRQLIKNMEYFCNFYILSLYFHVYWSQIQHVSCIFICNICCSATIKKKKLKNSENQANNNKKHMFKGDLIPSKGFISLSEYLSRCRYLILRWRRSAEDFNFSTLDFWLWNLKNYGIFL